MGGEGDWEALIGCSGVREDKNITTAYLSCLLKIDVNGLTEIRFY